MGRRVIMGSYGEEIPQSEHGFPDDQLVMGGAYGRTRGVSRQRVNINFKQKLINRYLNSKGALTYHPASCDREWQEQSDPSSVSTPTTGQMANGMDGMDATAIAGDFTPTPAPVNKKTKTEIPESPEDRKKRETTEKSKAVYSAGKAKRIIIGTQLDEVKLNKEKKLLVDRETLKQIMGEVGGITCSRVLAVSSSVMTLIDGVYKSNATPGDKRRIAEKRLDAALRAALSSVSEDGLAGILYE